MKVANYRELWQVWRELQLRDEYERSLENALLDTQKIKLSAERKTEIWELCNQVRRKREKENKWQMKIKKLVCNKRKLKRGKKV